MKILSYFVAMLILCSSLTLPALAEEVWIMDPESSPVVISEDGTQTSVASEDLMDPGFSFLDPEPEVDTTPVEEPTAPEEPAAEDPVSEEPAAEEPAAEEPSAEEPVAGDLSELIGEELWDESWLTEEPAVMSYSVMSVSDLNDPETVSSGSGEDQSMKEVIVQVFGEYSPRTQTVTQYLSDGTLLGTTTEIVPGVAGMDWQWISGVALFALVLSSFLKLVGVLLKNG